MGQKFLPGAQKPIKHLIIFVLAFALLATATQQVGAETPNVDNYNDSYEANGDGTLPIAVAETLNENSVTNFFLLGDVNCDNSVDMTDSEEILAFTVGLRTAVTDCALVEDGISIVAKHADATLDGTIDVRDGAQIARCITDNDPNECKKAYYHCANEQKCIYPGTLRPEWFGTLSESGDYTHGAWEPIAGAFSYEIQWFFDGDYIETTVSPTPTATWDMIDQNGERICARLRGVNDTDWSPWSPRTCFDHTPPPTPQFGEPTLIGTTLEVPFTASGNPIVDVWIDDQRLPDPVFTDTYISIPVPTEHASVCVAMRTIREGETSISEYESLCADIHPNGQEAQILSLDLDPAGSMTSFHLPTTFTYDQDGAIEGAITEQDLEQYFCTDFDGKIIQTGTNLTIQHTDQNQVDAGYFWVPDGHGTVSSGVYSGTKTGGATFWNSAAIFLRPFASHLVSTTNPSVSFENNANYGSWDPVTVPGIGRFERIFTKVSAFPSWNFTLEVQTNLTDEASAPGEPCSIVRDPLTFASGLGATTHIESERSTLEAICGGAWNCVAAAAEVIAQFIPGYDCVMAIVAVIEGRTPSNDSLFWCAVDGLFVAAPFLRLIRALTLFTKIGKHIPFRGIKISGANVGKLYGKMKAAFKTFCSFSGDTQITLQDGATVDIDDINVGDLVLTHDTKTGTQTYKPVTNTFHHIEKTLDLELSNGETITTTATHPFFDSTSQEWIPASELTEHNTLVDQHNQPITLTAKRYTGEYETTYNLTVADQHNFYAGTDETQLLVHNTCQFDPNRFMRNFPTSTVYILAKGTKIIYAGISNNAARRYAQHRRAAKLDFNNSFSLSTGNLWRRGEARSIEQAILDCAAALGIDLANQINSIADSHEYKADASAWGLGVLKTIVTENQGFNEMIKECTGKG